MNGAVVLLLGLATAALAETPAQANLFFVGSRECATAATGCELAGPHGALAAERKIVDGLGAAATVWAGTSFRCREAGESADALAKAASSYRALGAVALGVADVTLPKRALARWAKAARKPFVVSNASASGAPWKVRADLVVGGRKIRVHSLLGPEAAKAKGLRWSDPAKSWKRKLAATPSDVTNVVVVSTSDWNFMANVANYPRADIVIDANGAIADWTTPDKLKSGAWLASLPERARYGHAFRIDGKGNVVDARRVEIAP